jgi:hypothetical protein
MDLLRARFRVPGIVLAETRAFFEQQGFYGHEGTALLVGRYENNLAVIRRLFVPEQIAYSSRFGVGVELTPRAHFTLTDNLEHDERFFARIHSHPGRAYHSPVDDENQVINHVGALSIVVPYFARDPIVLERCAVFRYCPPNGWLPLSTCEISTTFEVVE